MMAMTRDTTNGGEGFVVSHKAGGGTFAELAATGARALVRDISQIKNTPLWEHENLKAWKSFNLCESFPAYSNRVPHTGYYSFPDEFTGQFFQMLQTEGPPDRPFDNVDSKQLFLDAVNKIDQSSKSDETYQARQKSAYEMGTFSKV